MPGAVAQKARVLNGVYVGRFLLEQKMYALSDKLIALLEDRGLWCLSRLAVVQRMGDEDAKELFGDLASCGVDESGRVLFMYFLQVTGGHSRQPGAQRRTFPRI